MRIQLSDHFTTGKLLRFVAPSIVMMIFTSVYGVVDGLFVSNFVGKTAFAAVNLIFPLLMILGALGFMIGTGGSALVARTLGEGDSGRAQRYFSMLVYVTIGGGIVFSVLGLLFLRPIAVLLGAQGAMLEDCVVYGGILLAGQTMFMLQNVFQSFLTVSLAAAKDLGYTIESDGSYTVTSADGLMNVAELVNGGKTDINITLDKNIDLTGKGWTPIGTSFDNSYKGTFDGGGHTITGLTVTTNDQFVGLFGYLNRAGMVKNVVMEGIQITSNHMFGCTGGVVGYSWGTIENCSVSGSVSGTDCVGGVVGSQKAGSIIGCSSSATVKGKHYVGGVAGEKWGTMTACYATGNVTLEIASQKNNFGGGVVGLNGGSRVLACYATGNVTSTGSSTGNVHIGGLFGDSYTTVTACYWKNNQERGYKTAPESTKVDGTYVTWQKAVDAMNTALQNAGSEWRYELNGALPTLRKQ